MTRPRALALLGLLLAATALAYLPGVDGDFLLDDEALLADPLVRAPFEHGLRDWASAPRPVSHFTFALNQLAVGVDSRGWHVTNVALHLAAVLLAWLFVRETLGRAGLARPEPPALAAAAIFALHPLQSEAVAYLSQRSECLAAGLYLAAMLLLLARDDAGGPWRRGALLAGAGLSQVVGALAKPTIATLPAAWLLHAAILPARREEGMGPLRRVRARLGAAAPLFAISVASAVREISATKGSPHAGFEVPGLPPLAYLATQLRVIPTYLGLALWPAGQCADWDVRPSAGFADPSAVGGGLFLAAIVVAALLLSRRAAGREGDGAAAARTAGFGIPFFLLTLAPSSSVVPLLDPLAEHRVYLGLLGLAAAAAAAGAWLLRRFSGPRAAWVGGAILLLVLPALGVATARRSAVWTSRLALWTDAAAKAPGKSRVQLNLGTALYYERKSADALAAIRRAWALRGDHTVSRDDLLLNLATALTSMGRVDEARGEMEAELRRDPRSAMALGLLAQAEFVAGRERAAESAAARALAIDPRNPPALKHLGFIRSSHGDLEAARALLLAAAEVQSLDTAIFLELGSVEERRGDRDAACAAYGRAARERGWPAIAAKAQRGFEALGCR